MHYKLYYFGVRGRGECIRQLFHLAGMKFEEVTISMEEWPQYKEQMPLGQIPVLEVDGVKIAQTMTIMKFLGHQFRRAGSDPIQCAKLDMIAEVVHDMFAEQDLGVWARTVLGMIPGDKDAVFKSHVQPVIDKFAPIIEKFLLENGNNGLLIGDKETWADVFTAEAFCRFVDFGDAKCLDAFPHIKDLITRVHNTPAIRKHLETRPQTPF